MVRSLLFLFVSCVALASCSAAPPAPSTDATPARFFPAPPSEPSPAAGLQTAVFAGGCFWGIEAVFEKLKGVTQAVSGYSGGLTKNPGYDEVSSGSTGHAEAVEVTFDPQVVSYGTLLKVFFSVAMDPTQLDYQGPDHGTQYRSALFTKTPEQMATAKAYIKILSEAKIWKDRIVTEVTPFTVFWPAEDYHQDFIKKNPKQGYIVRFDLPKLNDLEKQWPELVVGGVAMETSKFWHGLKVVSPEEPIVYPIIKSEAQWKMQLSGLAYTVLRQEGTERAGTGPLVSEHRKGTFYSAATGQPLFRSEDKYESGTGWPSFTRPITPSAVVLRLDNSYGWERVEVEDSSSGSHLGHVFDDGPEPTGLRYCMNSVSLLFVADGEEAPSLVKNYHP